MNESFLENMFNNNNIIWACTSHVSRTFNWCDSVQANNWVFTVMPINTVHVLPKYQNKPQHHRCILHSHSSQKSKNWLAFKGKTSILHAKMHNALLVGVTNAVSLLIWGNPFNKSNLPTYLLFRYSRQSLRLGKSVFVITLRFLKSVHKQKVPSGLGTRTHGELQSLWLCSIIPFLISLSLHNLQFQWIYPRVLFTRSPITSTSWHTKLVVLGTSEKIWVNLWMSCTISPLSSGEISLPDSLEFLSWGSHWLIPSTLLPLEEGDWLLPTGLTVITTPLLGCDSWGSWYGLTC